MKGKMVSLPIKDIKFSDESQDGLKKVTLYICKSGSVLSHGLFIEEDSIINAQESLKNRPLLCAYETDTEGNKIDFKGHEMDYSIVKNGSQYEIKIVYIEQPVGLIPEESSNIRMEEVDGEMWCVADGYLYEEYCDDAIRILEENDGNKCVSMEIKVLDSEDNPDDKLCHIKEFRFKGVTLLGEAHPPAISGANIQTFSQNDTFALQFDKLIERVNKLESNVKGEGGIKLEERQIIINKYSMLKNNKNFEAITSNEKLSNEELEKQLFSLSVNDLESKIRESLSKITYVETDWWGDTYECRKYWLRDVLVEENIAIVEDNEDFYKTYGIAYSINGDVLTLDFDNAVRYVRGDWRKYEEGMPVVDPNPIFEDISKHNTEKATSEKTNFEAVNKELEAIKANFTDLQTDKVTLEKEVETLKEENQKFENKLKEDGVNKIIEEFSELSNIKGFDELFDKKFEITPEDLRIKLKAFAYDNGIVIGKKKEKEHVFSATNGLITTSKSNVNGSDENFENLTEAEKRYGLDIKKYLG